MLQTYKILYDEIENLPIEKIGKALSYLRYLKQEQEAELYLDPQEEAELQEILANEDGTQSSEMLALIKGLPDD